MNTTMHWFRSFGLMVSWEARSMRIVLPLAVVSQVILGAGLIIGFGFLVGSIPTLEATFLATGVTGVVGAPASSMLPEVIQFAVGSDDLSSLLGTEIPDEAELLTLGDVFGGNLNVLSFTGAGQPAQQVRFDITSFTAFEISGGP